MKYSISKATDELAEVVWASHILSYLNPYTSTASDEPLQPDRLPIDREVNGDDGGDFDDSPDISVDTETLTGSDEVLREKLLDCVSELLAHTKGGKYVTATALREEEDSVEIDIARNHGFNAKDEAYLTSLAKFLAMQGNNISHQDALEYCHSFLEETIAYNANRVDFWAERVAELLRGSPYRPPRHSSVADQSKECTCLLGCCSGTQISVPNATNHLVLEFLNFNLRPSTISTSAERDDRRRKIVQLAAAATRSSETTQSELRRIVPAADPLRIIKLLRALARPVTNLQIVSRISQLLPNFRSVTFTRVSPPAPVQLQSSQIVTIWEAWKYLDRPFSSAGRIPPVLARKDVQFRSECSRMLPSHCEMQLMMRYEAEPSLTPTLAYFGCSKKACFLCDSFLAMSPLKARTRGRHGMCHPLWGVQPCDSETICLRLKKLCGVVKQKIRVLLEPGPRPSTIPMQQSSAVSELKSADMVEIRRQSENREMADRSGQEFREKMQILLDPRSVGPQVIWYRDLMTLCVMCQAPQSKRCTRCFATWYCSTRCQALDWPAHKLLCSRYLKFLGTRPSSAHKVGIWFPRDIEKPKLIWAPVVSRWDFHYPFFESFLGPNHGVLFTLPFAENKRRGLELDHYLTIYYRDFDETTSKSVHRTVEASHGMTVPCNMRGDYVAMSGRAYDPGSEFRDMTLADFRHVLDYFSTYFDDTVRETPSGGSVLAVKISCPLEQALYGRDTFTSVAVDRDFPSTSGISALSEALGDPLRICALERADLERDMDSLDQVPENGWHNPYADILMTDIDPASKNWGKLGDFWHFDGSVILLRENRTDLDVEWARNMSGYCLEVLKPLLEKSVAGDVSPQDVLAEATLEKMMAWKPVETPRKVAETRPRRGFVARMGSQRWHAAKQHSHVLNVTDKVLSSLV